MPASGTHPPGSIPARFFIERSDSNSRHSACPDRCRLPIWVRCTAESDVDGLDRGSTYAAVGAIALARSAHQLGKATSVDPPFAVIPSILHSSLSSA